jgi:hypothetical protein
VSLDQCVSLGGSVPDFFRLLYGQLVPTFNWIVRDGRLLQNPPHLNRLGELIPARPGRRRHADTASGTGSTAMPTDGSYLPKNARMNPQSLYNMLQ